MRMHPCPLILAIVLTIWRLSLAALAAQSRGHAEAPQDVAANKHQSQGYKHDNQVSTHPSLFLPCRQHTASRAYHGAN